MFKLKECRFWIAAFVVSVALVAGGAQADEAPTKPAAKPYPLAVCLVSDAPLDAMGGPVVIEHKGQEVKFCCSHCIPKFEKEPEKYLKKLEKAKKPATTQPADAADEHEAHH